MSAQRPDPSKIPTATNRNGERPPLPVVFALQLLPASNPGADRLVSLSTTEGGREELHAAKNVLHVQQRGLPKNSYRFDYIRTEVEEDRPNSPSRKSSQPAPKMLDWLRLNMLNNLFDPKKDVRSAVLFSLMPNSSAGEVLFGGAKNGGSSPYSDSISLSPKLATSFLGRAQKLHSQMRHNSRGSTTEQNVTSELTMTCYSMCIYQQSGEHVEYGAIDLLDHDNIHGTTFCKKLPVVVPDESVFQTGEAFAQEPHVDDLTEADFSSDFLRESNRNSAQVESTVQLERLFGIAAAARRNIAANGVKLLGSGWTVLASVITLRMKTYVREYDGNKPTQRACRRLLHFVELEKDVNSTRAFMDAGADIKSHAWVQQMIRRTPDGSATNHRLRQLLEPALVSDASPWVGVVANLEKEVFQSSQTARVFGPEKANVVTRVLSFLKGLGLAHRTGPIASGSLMGAQIETSNALAIANSSDIANCTEIVAVDEIPERSGDNDGGDNDDDDDDDNDDALSDGIDENDDSALLQPYFERDMALQTAATTHQHLAEAIRSQQEQTIELETSFRTQLKESEDAHRSEIAGFIAEVSALKKEKLSLRNELQVRQRDNQELQNELEVSQLALRESAQAYADLREFHDENVRQADQRLSEATKDLADAKFEQATAQDVHVDIEKKWVDERSLLEARIASLERQVHQQAEALKDAAASRERADNASAPQSPSSHVSRLEALQSAEEKAAVTFVKVSGVPEEELVHDASNEVQNHDAMLTARVEIRTLEEKLLPPENNLVQRMENNEVPLPSSSVLEEPAKGDVSADELEKTGPVSADKLRKASAQGVERLKELLASTAPDMTKSTVEVRSSSTSKLGSAGSLGGEHALRGQLERSLDAMQSGRSAATELRSELERERKQQGQLASDLRRAAESEFDSALDQVVTNFEGQCEATTTHVQTLQTKFNEHVESLEIKNMDLESQKRELNQKLEEMEASVQSWRTTSTDADKKITDLILTMSANVEKLEHVETERDEALAKCEQLQQDLVITHKQCIELRRALYSGVPKSHNGSPGSAVAEGPPAKGKGAAVTKPLTKSQALTTQILEAVGVNRYLIQAAVRDTNAEVLEYMASTPVIGSPSGRKKASFPPQSHSPDPLLQRRLEDEKESLEGLQKVVAAIQKSDLSPPVHKDEPGDSRSAFIAYADASKKHSKKKKLSEKEVETVRHHMRSAAYTEGGTNFAGLLRHADKNHDGQIDYEEFHSFVRRVLHLSPSLVPDKHVEILFELLDEDSSGTVTLDEVISFASGGAGWQGYHGERVRQHSRSPEQPIRSTRPIAKQPWWNATRNVYNQLPKRELEAIRYLIATKAYNIIGGATAVKVFASLGRDQNGTLDPDDFHKFVRERLLLSSSEMPDKNVALAFHSIDTDLSGKIELRELLALVYEYVDAADESRQEVFQPRGRSPTRKSRPKLHAPRTIAAQPKRSAKSIADKPYWKAQRRKGFPKKKLEKIRHHLYSAAYRYAGKDVPGLFKHLDKDHNGYLDPNEFHSFMRRILRLPPRVVSDADIAIVFRIIDEDDSGAVDIDEIIAFANKGAGWHGYHATQNPPPAMPADDSADLSDADVDNIDGGLENDMDM